MRPAFLVLTVIALLIVGILVLQNMQSGTADGISQKEAVEKAENAAEAVQRTSENTAKAVKETMDRMQKRE